MDLDIMVLSKEKDKHHMISLMIGILKTKTNELIYRTEINFKTQKTNLRLPKGKEQTGINQAFGINRYTLVYIK